MPENIGKRVLAEQTPMSLTPLSDDELANARRIWSDYQKKHDVSGCAGKAAGIDPVSGRIWFGESGLDIRRQMEAQGMIVPFYCVRVGQDHYLCKGGRR